MLFYGNSVTAYSTTVSETFRAVPPRVKLSLLSTLPFILLLFIELRPLDGTIEGSLVLLVRDERPLLSGFRPSTFSFSSPLVVPSSVSSTPTPRGGGGKKDKSMSFKTDWLMEAEV